MSHFRDTMQKLPDDATSLRPAASAPYIHGETPLLRVLRDLAEVDHYTVFVPDYLGIMSGWDRDHFARRDFLLAAVIHMNAHPALQAVTEMEHLAAVRAGDRFDIRRPTPARLERGSQDRPAGHAHHVRHSVPPEHPGLVRLVKGLDLN